MAVKIIIDSYGVPSGVIRGDQIESWDSRLDDALALPTVHRSSKTTGKVIADLVHPGRKGDLNDILDTISLKGFYVIDKEMKEDMADSTIEERSDN